MRSVATFRSSHVHLKFNDAFKRDFYIFWPGLRSRQEISALGLLFAMPEKSRTLTSQPAPELASLAAATRIRSLGRQVVGVVFRYKFGLLSPGKARYPGLTRSLTRCTNFKTVPHFFSKLRACSFFLLSLRYSFPSCQRGCEMPLLHILTATPPVRIAQTIDRSVFPA